MINTLSAIVIDDDALARQILINDIHSNCTFIQVLAESDNAWKGKELIEALSPDLVFIDVELPQESGIKMLQKMGNRAFIAVIYSSYPDFAFEAIKLDVADYLLKPLDPEALKSSMSKIYMEVLEQFEDKLPTNKMEVYTSGKRYFIRLKEIMYVRASGSYAEIHMKKNEKLVVSRNLKKVEEMLNHEMFMRVHNSILVNLNYVRCISFRQNNCTIMNGDVLPVSVRKRNELKVKLQTQELTSAHHQPSTVPIKGRA
ncbi:MAG: LytR/AlgR family response regulator transcription factor [Flavobacteriales bacterium]